MKKEKGITLIALIITIIVMLILVGVSINILIKSDLIGATKRAADATQDSLDKEGHMEDYITVGNETLGNYLANLQNDDEEETDEDALPEGWTKIADASIPTGWDTSKVTPITDGTNNVPLPKGYSISEEAGEQTVDGGLVIKDSHNNEFVWIPVTGDLVNPYTNSNNSNLSEPKVLTSAYSSSGYAYDSQETLDFLYGENYFNYANDFKYSDEYADMVTSVNKFDGFFVGRYETTIETIDDKVCIGSKEGRQVLTANLSMFKNDSTDFPYRWYGLYYAQKTTNYIDGNGETVQSAMIYGQLWDKVMTFVNEKTDGAGNTFNIYSYSRLRHTGSKANSGQNINDKVQNIYDLEGNFHEWTQEAVGTNNRRLRRGLLLRILL